jgi:hypothetical protein
LPSLSRLVLPVQVVAGQPLTIHLPIEFYDSGTAIRGRFSLKVLIGAYPGGTSTAATSETALLSTAKTLSLKPKKIATVPVVIRSLNTLPAGDYHFCVQMLDPAGAALSAFSEQLTVVAPFLGVNVVGGVVTPMAIARNRLATAMITITNAGNINETGKLTIVLSPSTGFKPVAGVTLTEMTVATHLRLGKPRKFRMRFKLPSGLAAGTYGLYIVASIDGTTDTEIEANFTAD